MEQQQEAGIYITYTEIERVVRVAGFIGMLLFSIRIVHTLFQPVLE